MQWLLVNLKTDHRELEKGEKREGIHHKYCKYREEEKRKTIKYRQQERQIGRGGAGTDDECVLQ